MEKALAIQKQVIEILGTDEVYLVGGSVRDIVMGNEPKDYDFTTPMLPDDIELMCLRRGRHPYTIGKKFGTIGFKVPVNPPRLDIKKEVGDNFDGMVQWPSVQYEYVEVTTFRSEVYTSKSRKPEVAFVTSLDEDLSRRDFTMNAMVLRPDGTIYDPYGGKLHIHKKHIVTVGMPKDRIAEDPLRMLRAARFAARYNFTIDANFIGKARQLAYRIYDVSVERWVMELDKLLTSDDTYHGLHQLHEMAILQRILPELYHSVDEDTNKSGDIYVNPFDCHGDTKTYESADIAWKFLLNHIHTPDVIKDDKKTTRYINGGICARLKFSNERIKKILDK